MKQQESLISIAALVIALSLTLLLFFSNFTFVLSIKLLQTGNVNVGRYFFVLLVTLVNAAIVTWLGYLLWKMRQRQKPNSTKSSIQNSRHIHNQERPSRPSYQLRRQKTEQDLRKFAEHKNKFTMQDVLDVTGFDLLESQHLIDDLILQKVLKAESQRDSFAYYFNNNPS